LRRSWGHKWKLLVALELFFSPLLSLYENSITVNVVVPLIPKPFLNTRELYDKNYTFVVQSYNFGKTYDWFTDEYNTKNHRRVLQVHNFLYLGDWLERYFLSHQNDAKYAIVGYFFKQFQFQAVAFVKERKGTCYQMHPTEKELYPEPFFFGFASAIGPSLHTGLSLLQAVGFVRVFEASLDSRNYLIALNYTNSLVAKYDKEIDYIDFKNNKFKESLITLGNMMSVIYVGFVMIASARVTFLAEVFSKEIVFMMLTK